jgi:hypothetical protein
MRSIFILFLLLFNTTWLYSQSPIYPKNKTIKFLFFEGTISDTNKLKLKISFTNIEKDTILIPVSLIDGPMYSPFGNIYIELQKFNEGKYNRFVDKTVDYFYGDSTPEVKKSYKKLKPRHSEVLSFNLISRIGAFYKGNYRMRVHLLKIPINDPPQAPMEYTISRWFYFQVIKDLVYRDIY